MLFYQPTAPHIEIYNAKNILRFLQYTMENNNRSVGQKAFLLDPEFAN